MVVRCREWQCIRKIFDDLIECPLFGDEEKEERNVAEHKIAFAEVTLLIELY